MTRSELIRYMAKSQSMTVNQSERYLCELIDVMTAEIANGNEVHLLNFGTFKTRIYAKRTVKTPDTQVPAEIPNHDVPIFVPSAALRKIVREA